MVVVQLQSLVQLCDPMDCVDHQASLSMGFSRPDHWSGLPFPSPGDLPNPGIEPWSPALQADSLPTELPGNSPPWNMGELHFEARDGYFNRVMLNVQGKSPFYVNMVLLEQFQPSGEQHF